MILSVSRRTDIPAFYTPWFLNRLRQGYVLVRNPMNYYQVSRISLSPSVIDCIVFWTKNPAPLLPHLEEIGKKYPFYFQFTLNPYGPETEPALPPLEKRLETFLTLSKEVGAQRLVWRYDPVFLSESYPVSWHLQRFQELSRKLEGHVEEAVFSFIDLYPKVQKNIRGLGIRECTVEEMQELAAGFSAAGKEAGIRLRTCAEEIDLDQLGISHGCCVDRERIEKLTGATLSAKKDPNQRQECGCLESIDIGQYNTCRHLCKYCYANFNPGSVQSFSSSHDPQSPYLTGGEDPRDKITERKMKSLKKGFGGQLSFF